MFDALLQDDSQVALFLFPTKALAQDQLGSLKSFVGTGYFGDTIRCATLDGDTPRPERQNVKENANVILTNPDLLHVTLLPKHETWHRIMSKLR